MKRLPLLLLAVILTTKLFGQKYFTADIRTKADSILRNYISDTLFSKYCFFDTDTYYEYKDIFGNTHWETLNKFKKTKGKFVTVALHWNLIIPYSNCPAYDTIKGQVSFSFDSLLRSRGYPFISSIPDFYWSKDTCHLINIENAIAIARQQNLKTDTGSLKAKIFYDPSKKIFIWEVTQILWIKKDRFNKDYGEFEMVAIDASNGEIIYHYTADFGSEY